MLFCRDLRSVPFYQYKVLAGWLWAPIVVHRRCGGFCCKPESIIPVSKRGRPLHSGLTALPDGGWFDLNNALGSKLAGMMTIFLGQNSRISRDLLMILVRGGRDRGAILIYSYSRFRIRLKNRIIK